MKVKPEQNSTSVHVATPAVLDSISAKTEDFEQKCLLRSSAAYEIAASAAFYVQSQTKDVKDDHQEEEEEESSSPRVYKSEMAASVAASTMTAVIAADENQKQEAARDLQSIHSSPCEWFVCDDSSIYTRCFVIQVIKTFRITLALALDSCKCGKNIVTRWDSEIKELISSQRTAYNYLKTKERYKK